MLSYGGKRSIDASESTGGRTSIDSAAASRALFLPTLATTLTKCL